MDMNREFQLKGQKRKQATGKEAVEDEEVNNADIPISILEELFSKVQLFCL